LSQPADAGNELPLGCMVKRACRYLALTGFLSATDKGGVHWRSLSNLFVKISVILSGSSWATHVWLKSFLYCTSPWLVCSWILSISWQVLL